MLVGLPAAGKSTFARELAATASDIVIVSADDHIEALAAGRGETYREAFSEFGDLAMRRSHADLLAAIAAGRSIVWDQLNLSVGLRAARLGSVPSSYRKIAIYFPTPSDWRERLARAGKEIASPVLDSLVGELEPPTIDEGFDEVRRVEG